LPNAVTRIDQVAGQKGSLAPLATSNPAPAPYWFLNPAAWFALLALKAYQTCIPSRYKPQCRQTPSCSRYMALAVRKYGVSAGLRLGWRRFRRCVGFGPKGENWP
jgi:putative component of membrane protein insertase Oxa1/YidC/SpoIIIJ protein YidD